MMEAVIGMMWLQAKDTRRIAGNHQKAGTGKEGFFPYSFQREHDPANTLIPEVYPPEL